MKNLPEPARALQVLIERSIPLARHIGLVICHWDGRVLAARAPLAPNINDKGCAFGGSLASSMTLAAWSLVTLLADTEGLDCDIFVARSQVAYLAPVWTDFEARAECLDADDVPAFLDTLRRRGKAGIKVACRVRECGGERDCATLEARFVAKRRDGAPPPPAAGT